MQAELPVIGGAYWTSSITNGIDEKI